MNLDYNLLTVEIKALSAIDDGGDAAAAMQNIQYVATHSVTLFT